MPRKGSMFYSALLLTGVNLLLRLIGTSFQVYISRRIGAEGVGLLQLVMSVGSMSLVAGTAGIRTATMYMTAGELGRKRAGNIKGVLSGCSIYSILCSGAVAALLWFFSPLIAEHWIGNIHADGALRLFSAFLPVSCLSGVMVGYFTGAGRIGTLAAVEVAEQLISMAVTTLALILWAGTDPGRACQAVVLGSGLGSCVTVAALVLLRLMEHPLKGQKLPMGRMLRKTAVPLAMADNLRTGISTVENLMVPKRLELYPGAESPLAAYGTICGMVFPVMMFPAAILFGLTELLVPELARCSAAGSKVRTGYLVRRTLRLALLYGTACAGVLFLCAGELCSALYGSSQAGVYLKWFSVLCVMLYCDAVTDAMIKGLGQQAISVRYNIMTNTMDVIMLFLLLPVWGIGGYFVSFLISHAINFFLSLRRLLITSNQRIDWFMPLGTIGCGAGAVMVTQSVASALLRVCVYLTVLICLLFLTGILSREDVDWVKGLIKKK